MFNVIVLGSLPLSTKIIEMLESMDDVNVVGVICRDINLTYIDESNNKSLPYNYCNFRKIKIYKVEDIKLNNDLDLAISARNNDILKPWFLNKFKKGIINCHGGYLPDYRGVGGHIFPIVNKENFTGASIHFMNERIDEGDLIARAKIKIEKYDSGFSLYHKINNKLFNLIEENINNILYDKIKSTPQSSLVLECRNKQSHYYKNRDIKNLIKIENIKECTYDVIRALYWPGKIKPYYCTKNGEKIFLDIYQEKFNGQYRSYS